MDMERLKDNSKVGEVGTELANLCWKIQTRIRDDNGRGRVFLVDLLGRSGLEEGEPPEIFRMKDGEVWTGNYIGFFEYPENGQTRRVTIGSRFGGDGKGQIYFPLAMLEACWDIPMLFLEEFRGGQENNPYELLLVLRLALQLERAWKSGQLRAYRSFPMYDSRMRGQLDLPRYIRQNMGLSDGRMAYFLREYTGDNDYTRLFLRALLEAEKRFPDFVRRVKQERPQFRLAHRALLQQVSGWERMDKHTLLVRTRKRIVNPIYREYEALRVTARAVLQRVGGYEPKEEDGAPFVTGIFLDISQLWEMYLIEKVFRRACSELPQYQADRKILEGMRTIRPDFWWERQGVVLDAKYRPVWVNPWDDTKEPTSWSKKIKNDVYQVLTYMLSLNCGQGGVIYPTNGPSQEPKPLCVSDRCWRAFWRVGFSVPAVSEEKPDYPAFRRSMEEEAERLARELSGSVFNRSESKVVG